MTNPASLVITSSRMRIARRATTATMVHGVHSSAHRSGRAGRYEALHRSRPGPSRGPRPPSCAPCLAGRPLVSVERRLTTAYRTCYRGPHSFEVNAASAGGQLLPPWLPSSASDPARDDLPGTCTSRCARFSPATRLSGRPALADARFRRVAR